MRRLIYSGRKYIVAALVFVLVLNGQVASASEVSTPETSTSEASTDSATDSTTDSTTMPEDISGGDALPVEVVSGDGIDKVYIDGGVRIVEVEFENDFVKADSYRLTNGDVIIYFELSKDVNNVEEAYYIWKDTPNVHLDVKLEDGGGFFVVDREGKGTVRLVCTDAEGNVMMAEESGLWIDKTVPEIDMGDDDGDMISMIPPAVLTTEVNDGEDGSGVVSVVYQLDADEPVEVSGEKFELSFEGNEEHTLTVIAEDRAGNESKVTKRISVNIAPIIKVTVPTDIDLLVLSSPINDDVNIVSEEWEVVNNSNVPVRATITEYSMNSDFAGEFEDSYLNLNMKYRSQELKIPLGFAYQTDVYQFELGKADYSKENEYLSSDDAARARFSYEGYAGNQFNRFLRTNTAVFHMTFVFEPLY
ncbi:MAG: hypothetical protein K2K10_08895 [Acetatifactor sp.]|nr:hypothetical protein [Acetatifactor sp.]